MTDSGQRVGGSGRAGAAGDEAVAERDDGASPYLTVGEAAALLRVTGAAITKWLRNGTLRGRKLGLRRWRVERASIEAALPDPAPAEPAPPPPSEPPPFERILALLPLLDEDARRQLAIAALSVVDGQITATRRGIVAAHERYTEEA